MIDANIACCELKSDGNVVIVDRNGEQILGVRNPSSGNNQGF